MRDCDGKCTWMVDICVESGEYDSDLEGDGVVGEEEGYGDAGTHGMDCEEAALSI